MVTNNPHDFNPEKITLVNLCLLGRASSVFITGLFDGHPSFSVIPSSFYPHQIDLSLPIQEIAKICHEKTIESIRVTLPDFKESKFPLSRFTELFLNYLKVFGVSREKVFLAIYYSFSCISGADVKKIRYIVFDPHSLEKIPFIISDFKKIKLLIAVRDPRSTYLSHKKYKNKIYGMIDLAACFRGYYKIMNRTEKDKIIILRHEDLHSDYPNTLKRILDSLKIKYSPKMEYSSFFGVPFEGGQSTLKINSAKPNKKFAAENWRNELSSYEIRSVQFFYKKLMKTFNYPACKPFDNPRYIFFDSELYPFSKNRLKSSYGLKGSLNRFIFSISKIPIIGRFFMWIYSIAYFFVRYLHRMSISLRL